MYIAKKILDLAQENKEKGKKSHIGYYLQNENILYQKLGIKEILISKCNKFRF